MPFTLFMRLRMTNEIFAFPTLPLTRKYSRSPSAFSHYQTDKFPLLPFASSSSSLLLLLDFFFFFFFLAVLSIIGGGNSPVGFRILVDGARFLFLPAFM